VLSARRPFSRGKGKKFARGSSACHRKSCRQFEEKKVKKRKKKLSLCEGCGTATTSLRRGRCSSCYDQWVQSRTVGVGARCIVCFDRRRENLRLVEYQGTWLPLCHNCVHRAETLDVLPSSIEGLRQRLLRDRRWSIRRSAMRDSRVFPVEQRKHERRANWVEEPFEWIDAAELIIEETILEEETTEEACEPTRIASETSIRGEKKSKAVPPPLPSAARRRNHQEIPSELVAAEPTSHEASVDQNASPLN
jgi:hypothetical protein